MTGSHEPLLYNPADEPRYAELARRAASALDGMDADLRRLAAERIRGDSPDGLISVRVTATGEVTEVRVRAAALRHYSSVRLGEVVTRTLRDTQQRARAAYERAAAAMVPAEVADCERLARHTGDE